MMSKWFLVEEVKKSLNRWWTGLGTLLFLLILLQTIFGQYQGIESLVWGWLIFGLLPGLALVYLGDWLNPYPDKLVAKESFSALRALCIALLLLLLFTILFSQAAVDRTEWGLDTYLRKSFLWVAPINLFVIIGLSLLFFHKKGLRQPSIKEIQETALQQSELPAAAKRPVRRACLQLVAAGNLSEALEKLWEYVQQYGTSKEQNRVVLLKGQYARIQENQNMQLISREEMEVSKNRISLSILNFASGIK